MSDLVVVAFNDEERAEEVRRLLFTMQSQYLLDLEDAVVVVKSREGKLSINQTHNLVASGAVGGVLYGSLWGVLLGALFFNPLLGWAAGGLTGGTVGGVSGWLTDIGIDDEFIKKLGKTIQEGNSALFVLIKNVTSDKVIKKLQNQGVKGTILQTSLSIDNESRLQDILQAKVQ